MKSYVELRSIQKEIGKRVLLQDKEPTLITRIGGIAMAFLNNSACVAYILVDYSSLTIMYQKTMMVHLSFPYIPTFLCFREGQPIINLLKSIEYPADILLINAHGIATHFLVDAHPM